MVARIGRIDRDEREPGPVFPMRHVGRLGRFCGRDRRCREDMGNTVLLEGDEADRLLAGDIADPLDDACGGEAEAVPSDNLD